VQMLVLVGIRPVPVVAFIAAQAHEYDRISPPM
jgi:hypothetical protein